MTSYYDDTRLIGEDPLDNGGANEFIGGWARLSDEQIDLSADLVITSAIKNFHK